LVYCTGSILRCLWITAAVATSTHTCCRITRACRFQEIACVIIPWYTVWYSPSVDVLYLWGQYSESPACDLLPHGATCVVVMPSRWSKGRQQGVCCVYRNARTAHQESPPTHGDLSGKLREQAHSSSKTGDSQSRGNHHRTSEPAPPALSDSLSSTCMHGSTVA
jgi:hypothetical protein